ncbi:unnamed protein product [Rotaria magnacalcarata]|uniref:Uncharacterized protein n=1 Tax=Rotaria magnacalcarata TaxID=392030 RepID=A0A8S3C8C4_9BILA|nr:unnamed protein product [Rotaria magnacalcarata]
MKRANAIYQSGVIPSTLNKNDLDNIQFEHDELTDNPLDNNKEVLKDNLFKEGQSTLDLILEDTNVLSSRKIFLHFCYCILRYSDLLSHPTSIREDNVENRTTRLASQELSVFDDHCSVTTNTANEITSTPAVDLELNIQIQIASGSCNLYTHCDLISNSSFTIKNTSKQQQQAQTTIGSIVNINNIEYQVSRFYLPIAILSTRALNKRASFYCRVMIQSPTSQITIHPLLLDFLEQTLEHVKLPREQEQMQTTNGQNSNNAHLNTMFLIGDQSSTASCPIDVVVSLFVFNHQFFYLHIYLLISWNVNFVCQLLIIPSSTTVENDSEQIIENSLGGLNIRPEQLQIRNALAASVQSVSFNVSRTRYTLIEREDDF